jgi:hypothetical protein
MRGGGRILPVVRWPCGSCPSLFGALRALRLGGPTARPIAEALAWIGGLLVFSVPAAVLRYRYTTAT